MNIKALSVVAGLLCLSAGACSAAQTVGQGVIQFRGSIVEPACATNARSGSVVEMTGCAAASRGNRIDVQPVASVTGVNGARAQLVAEVDRGRYYDQQYRLVDNLGKPLQAGNYVITLTTP